MNVNYNLTDEYSAELVIRKNGEPIRVFVFEKRLGELKTSVEMGYHDSFLGPDFKPSMYVHHVKNGRDSATISGTLVKEILFDRKKKKAKKAAKKKASRG